MELITLKKSNNIASKSSVALGVFDGVHLGHQEIIKSALKLAARKDLISSILTFKNHPRSLTINRCPKIITDFKTRLELFEDLGIEQVLALDFSLDIMYMSPKAYLKKYLLNELNVAAISVGYDHCFGKNREGTPEFLASWAKTEHVDLSIVDAFKFENELISSSKIRDLIASGKINEANKYLGHNFSLAGLVIKGDQRGRTIGFATANLKINEELIIPNNGVYLVDAYIRKALLDDFSWGQAHKALVNIGYRPSFKTDKLISVEVHILDFDENIYGEEMKIVFHKKIRDEKKFDSVTALIAQINLDIQEVCQNE